MAFRSKSNGLKLIGVSVPGIDEIKENFQTYIVQKIRQTAEGQNEEVNLLNQLPFTWFHTPRDKVFLQPTSNTCLMLLALIIAPHCPSIVHVFR